MGISFYSPGSQLTSTRVQNVLLLVMEEYQNYETVFSLLKQCGNYIFITGFLKPGDTVSH